jgi:hypothetical protein
MPVSDGVSKDAKSFFSTDAKKKRHCAELALTNSVYRHDMKTTFRLPLLLAVAALSCLCATASNAQNNLVQNGGFENGSLPPWTLNDQSGLSGVSSDPFFAHSGVHHAFLGTGNFGFGSLTQVLNTTPGQSYTLSFFLAHDVTQTPNNNFSVFFNGTVINGSQLTNVGTFGYTNFTFSGLVATSNSTPLTFSFRDSDDFFRLDTVTVVPEPSTYALLITAGGMVGFMQYRRNQRRRALAQA